MARDKDTPPVKPRPKRTAKPRNLAPPEALFTSTEGKKLLPKPRTRPTVVLLTGPEDKKLLNIRHNDLKRIQKSRLRLRVVNPRMQRLRNTGIEVLNRAHPPLVRDAALLLLDAFKNQVFDKVFQPKGEEYTTLSQKHILAFSEAIVKMLKPFGGENYKYVDWEKEEVAWLVLDIVKLLENMAQTPP